MTTYILGNGNNLSLSDDYSNGDTIILGNGTNDAVSANYSNNDIITLGNGAGDTVTAQRQQQRRSPSATAPATR